MPKGLHGDQRPADAIENAITIAKIATTEEAEDKTVHEGKNPHAVALGKIGGSKGGRARAEKLSKERRIEIARKAVQTRWNKSE